MATFKNPFNKDKVDQNQNKLAFPKSRVYFGGSKKNLPTRVPFKQRRTESKDVNFVPKPDLETLLKRWGYRFSFEGVKALVESIKNGELQRNIRFWFTTKIKRISTFFLSRTTQFALVGLFIGFILCYTIYLTFFSTEFLVKNYEVRFSQGSYIDKAATAKVLQSFSQKGILGYIPYNHFWFLNSQSLTNIAKSTDPSITQVQLIGRFWPSTAEIQISTQPILATLQINSQYYIISQNGQVIGQDYGGNRQKVVTVQTLHKNVDSSELTKVFAENRPDSKVSNNQLNRLYFIQKTLPKLQSRNLNIIRTEIKTIFEKDTDVFFITENETVMLFDSLNISLEENLNRLDTLIQTTEIGQDLQNGKIKYIDLRIRDRIYICYYGKECEDKIVNSSQK